jgi:RimJ/RimL family protein N-acetyltransferase
VGPGLTLPSLHGDRLRLEPVADEHLDLLVGLNADPEVMRFILGRAATPDETREEWSERRGLRTDAERGLGYWVGFADGEFVGWWSASAFAPAPARSGIGYRLRRSAWGAGYATEGARVMLDHAFAVTGVEGVFASTMAVNVGSRAVLTKLGLRHTDTWVQDWPSPAGNPSPGGSRARCSTR